MKKALLYIALFVFAAVLLTGLIKMRNGFLDTREQENTALEESKTASCEEKLSAQRDSVLVKRFEGSPKPVDFTSHANAKEYYTRITQAAKNGPNFSGSFTVVYWGCGTDCFGYSVVSAETGKII